MCTYSLHSNGIYLQVTVLLNESAQLLYFTGLCTYILDKKKKKKPARIVENYWNKTVKIFFQFRFIWLRQIIGLVPTTGNSIYGTWSAVMFKCVLDYMTVFTFERNLAAVLGRQRTGVLCYRADHMSCYDKRPVRVNFANKSVVQIPSWTRIEYICTEIVDFEQHGFTININPTLRTMLNFLIRLKTCD